MQKEIKFTKFLSTIEKKYTVAIFHRLHPIPVLFLKKESWENFKRAIKTQKNQKHDALFDCFKKYKLIVDYNDKEEIELKQIRKRFEKQTDQMSVLFLILTRSCNLNCEYCFMDRSSKQTEEKMDFEVAKKGVDLWIKNIKKNKIKNYSYSIIFYGGEPLLNFKTFVDILEYIRETKRRNKNLLKNIQILLDTNGILINKKVIKVLKRHGVKTNISVDGPKEIHDRYRVDKENKGTFERVINVFNNLKKEKVDICISVTVGPHNLKKIKEFSEFFTRYGIEDFSFISLTDQDLLRFNPGINLKKYREELAKEIIESFKTIRSKGIYEYRLEEKLKSFLNKHFFLMGCGGYGNQVVVWPNGRVGNCPTSSNYIINHVNNCSNDLNFRDKPLIKKWKERSPLFNFRCLNCKAISICDGGCPWVADTMRGNIACVENTTCTFSHKFLKFVIFEELKNNKKFVIRDFYGNKNKYKNN